MAYSLVSGKKSDVIVWEWEENGGYFVPYSPEVSNYIEGRNSSWTKTSKDCVIDLGEANPTLCLYKIDLQKMHQITTTTGKHRKIKQNIYQPESSPGKGIQWEWWSDYCWAPYDLHTSCTVEDCYSSKKHASMSIVDLNRTPLGVNYVIDILRMVQINKWTRYERKVRREKLSTNYCTVEDSAGDKKINGLVTSSSSSLLKRKIKRKTAAGDDKLGGHQDDPVEMHCKDVKSPPDEDCCICLEKLKEPSSHDCEDDSSSKEGQVKEMKNCQHMFHTSCLRAMYENSSKDGSLQCPTCKSIHGIKKGNQPDDGTMNVNITNHFLPGHEGYNTINIIYDFRGGIQGTSHPHPGKPYTARGFPRSCYLPNTKKGKKVLELLKIAWERKLIFTIGTSTTTGETDTVIWNEIHHKTSPTNHHGHGYPDPNYLDNVMQELAAHGVEHTDNKSSSKS